MTPYDVFRYPSRSYHQTHPERIAAMGILSGLQPKDVRACRVLEIGCGDGTNLIPMAIDLPESEFVGLDLAPSAIESGQSMVATLGIQNVRLLCQDLCLADAKELGTFDYILAHGVFSWVPEAVRRRLLELCRETLAPHGLAYISYNAYPGCHLREASRRMMRYHVRHIEDPDEQVQQGRALLNLLVNGRPPGNSAYYQILTEELKHSLEYHPAAFFHDDLSACNTPFYFHEFIEQAESQSLQFVAEADLREMQLSDDDCAAAAVLAQMGEADPLAREQYLDFFKGRRFRQTLLCHQGLSVDHRRTADRIANLRIAANLNPTASPDDQPEAVAFEGPRGSAVSATDPILKQALSLLAGAWPQSVAVADLDAACCTSDQHRNDMRNFLLEAVSGGAMELHSLEAPVASTVSQCPTASMFARWQAKSSELVTSLTHTSVRLPDEAVRHLLLLLDGSRDRQMLGDDLANAVVRGSIELPESSADPHSVVRETLEPHLQQLHKLALLRA